MRREVAATNWEQRDVIRIQGPSGTNAAGASSATRRGPSVAFSLGNETTAPATASAAGARTIGGIETLLALQGIEEPVERRRRAVKRGRNALDALDALKLGLLSGTLDAAALSRLKSAAAGIADPTGDPGLDGVLGEIGLRVEVELAKIGMPRKGQ